ncbi:MAG: 23S rRNA (pseudouridine(1915)-N(3))-methyltransferase RlmH [Thermoleophilia bacterium]
MGRRAPRLQIACVGRLRPPWDAPGRVYEERVDRMAGLRVDEVAAEPLQRGEDRARAAEAERLRAKLLPRAVRVALDPDGRAPRSSPAFAGWLERHMRDRPVAFVVGGAVGVAPELLAECDERIALGPLTMPHQLARVVLAEQLYRALCITSGHPYPH